MNSKTKTYLLLATVVSIWGYIGYKIVSKLNPDIPEITNDTTVVNFNPSRTIAIDTFSIVTLSKDPFLGTLTRTKKKTTTSKQTKNKQPVSSRNVIYKGLIKKQASKNQIFVVDINDKQYLLKKNQVADSVTLIRGNTKEIVIRFNNKTQTIAIK